MRKLLILTCLLGTVFTTNAQFWKKKNKKKSNTIAVDNQTDYKNEGAPLPKIKAVTLEDKVYTPDSFRRNLLIMTFNPTCGHCMDMAQIFSKNIELFKNTDILMLAAPTMKPYLDFFIRNTHVAEHKNVIKVALDSAGYIEKTFKYESLPQLNFYGTDKKLYKVTTGEQPLDSLRAYIK
jgi:thiol-disulfide isomerase/thioredoxin